MDAGMCIVCGYLWSKVPICNRYIVQWSPLNSGKIHSGDSKSIQPQIGMKRNEERESS